MTLVPDSIDPTGQTDVTGLLNAWLAMLPDPLVAEFPDSAAYRVDGTITLTKRFAPIIAGGGAMIFAETDGTEWGPAAALKRSQLRLVNCANPRVENLQIVGANTQGGVGAAAHRVDLEGQHCVSLEGCLNPELSHLLLYNPYGDCVYGRSDGLYVHDCTLQKTGRNALSIVTGRDVRVQGNWIDEIQAHVVDFETGASHSWKVDGADVSNNCIGSHRLNFISARGENSTVSNVDVHGNQLYSTMQINAAAGKDPTLRYKNWKVHDNISTFVRNATTPLMQFGHVDGLIVVNNVEPLLGAYANSPVRITDCPGALITPNNWKNP